MRKCPVCQQTYTDDSLNYCLNDGATLQEVKDEPAPTVFMNQARVTNPTNWGTGTDAQPPAYSWQNTPSVQNSQYMSPSLRVGQNQTLPVISLVLGIIGIVTCFCGGIPFGLAALITGYLGLSNANRDSQAYGGRGIAIAGMIVGGVGFAGALIWILLSIIGNH